MTQLGLLKAPDLDLQSWSGLLEVLIEKLFLSQKLLYRALQDQVSRILVLSWLFELLRLLPEVPGSSDVSEPFQFVIVLFRKLVSHLRFLKSQSSNGIIQIFPSELVGHCRLLLFWRCYFSWFLRGCNSKDCFCDKVRVVWRAAQILSKNMCKSIVFGILLGQVAGCQLVDTWAELSILIGAGSGRFSALGTVCCVLRIL